MKRRNVTIALLALAALAAIVLLGWPRAGKRTQRPPAQGAAAVQTGQGPRMPAGPATIEIIDDDGYPVPFAVVHIIGEVTPVRRSNVHGALEWPIDEAVHVVVSARGFLPKEALVHPETEFVRLRRGGHLVSGQVRDLYGGVVAGAMVGVPAGAMALTDDEGRFALTVAAGTWRIRAASPDYFPMSRVLFVTSAMSQDFELFPGGVIEGVVVDEEGAAAPGAWVSYTALVPRSAGYEHRPSSAQRRTQADEEGRFRLAPLEPATYRLLAQTPNASAEAPVSVRLALLDERSGVTLRVLPGSTLVGHVDDDQGSPVGGAAVVATHRAGYELEVDADEKGRFEVRGLHPGTWHLHARQGTSLLGDVVEAQVPASGVPKEVTLLLERGVSLRGSVRSGAGARLTLELPDGDMSFASLRRRSAVRGVEATADDDGTFVFDNIHAGAWKVVAMARDARSGSGVVSVRPGEDGVIELELEPSATVRGTVSNRSGSHKGLEVRLAGEIPLADVVVRENGSFVVDRVPTGSWALDVRHRGASVPILEGPSTVIVERGRAKPVELRVDTVATRLRGRVLSADEQPVADALIEARSVGRERLRAISDTDGRFSIASTSAAQYRIDVTGPSGLGLAQASDLNADADVVVTLEEPSSISGRVLLGGNPVRRFEVAPPGSGLFPVLFVDGDGAFELTDLRPGPATLSVFAAAGIASVPLELRAGATTEIVLSLEPWGRASGRVVDEDGAPVVGASVDVSSEAPRADGMGVVATDADGRFVLEGIGPGRTVFEVRMRGASTRTERHDVGAGDDLELGVLTL